MIRLNERTKALQKIADTVFDVAIIGGGITGSGIVRDAQSRGLRAILLEKDDFASGTSSKSGKLIHGGLRYLNYGQFKLVFDACRERHLLFNKVAPHLVRPVPFLLSFYKTSARPRWLIALGLFLYDVLSLYRNIERFHILSPAALGNLEPALKKKGSYGGLRFYDCMGLDYRLTIDTLKSAREWGATLLNYCQVQGISLASGARCHALACMDRISHKTHTVQAKVIINAAGAWCDDLLHEVKRQENFRLKISRGIHLVVDNQKLGLRHAIGFEGQGDRRNIYAVPWGSCLLLGTTDTFYEDDKDRIPINSQDVDYLLSSFNQLFPHSPLKRGDCLSAYAGIRPLMGSDNAKKESELSRDFSIKKSKDGFVSITGGKLTTYRHMAESLMNQVMADFFRDKGKRKARTDLPISGGQRIDLTREEQEDIIAETEVSQASFEHLIGFYGSNYAQVLAYVLKEKEKGKPIRSGCPQIWAEIDYAIDYEFAMTLQDFVLRRSTIFLFSRDNGLAVCPQIAAYMGHCLKWSAEKIQEEVDVYQQYVQNIHQMVRGGQGA